MKKLWYLKKVFSNLELEGQGFGIIMGVTRLLLLRTFYTIQTKRDQTFCRVVYLGPSIKDEEIVSRLLNSPYHMSTFLHLSVGKLREGRLKMVRICQLISRHVAGVSKVWKQFPTSFMDGPKYVLLFIKIGDNYSTSIPSFMIRSPCTSQDFVAH